MEAIQKKIGKKMSFCMGLTMSFCLSLFCSLFGMLMSGHFKFPAWLASFAVSFVLSFIISMIIGYSINMRKLTENYALKHNITSTTKRKVVDSIIADLIYTPVITLLMVAVACVMANKGIDRSYDNLEKDKAALEAEIAADQSSVAELTQALEHETDPTKIGELTGSLEALNGAIGGKMGGVAEMEQSLKDMDNDRPTYLKMLPSSLVLGLIIAFFIGFFLQPLYLKRIFILNLNQTYYE